MVVDVERATQAWNSLETVIPHELSHLLFAEKVGPVPMPIWFLEGLAKWQADEWSMVDSWQLMNAVWSNQAPKLWQIQNKYPEGENRARDAYRVSYEAFTFLLGKRMDQLPVFLDKLTLERDYNAAFQAVFNESPAMFYTRFHDHLEARYHSPLLLFQTGPLFSVLAVVFMIVSGSLYFRKRLRLRNMPDEPDSTVP